MIDRKLKLILYLTLSISLISLSHALFPLSVFFALPVIPGIYLDMKNKHLLSTRWTTILAIIGFLAFTFVALRFPFEAIGYLLIYLVSLRILGEKHLREYKQIFALSFFALVASSIFHYSLIFLMYVVLYILMASFTLLIFSFIGDTRKYNIDTFIFRKLLSFVLYFDFTVIIFSIPLFVILPRSPYVFFRAPSYLHSEIQGFGDEITVGEISGNFNMDRVIMRIKPLGKISAKILYIRGNVLNYFDGKVWKRTHKNSNKWQKGGKIQFVEYGKTSGKYQIQLNPIETKILYTVDFPHTVFPGKLHASRGWGRVVNLPSGKISHIVTYKSFSTDVYKEQPEDKETFLFLPHQLEGLIDSLLLSIGIKRELNTEAILTKIEKYFNNNFRYTIEAPPLKDPVRDFLDKKEGYCEHFATLATLMLRRLGIPSRLVVGFRTVEWNPYGKYFVIRVKHAHAWVEYFSHGQWFRFDPTPAQGKINYITRISEYWDYLIYLWNTQVLQFNYLQQIKIFLDIKLKFRELSEFKIPKWVFPFIIIFAISFFILLKLLHRSRVHPSTLYLYKFEKIMKRRGYEFKPGETPMEFSQRLNNQLIKEFISLYYQTRFGKDDPQKLKKLYSKIKKIF